MQRRGIQKGFSSLRGTAAAPFFLRAADANARNAGSCASVKESTCKWKCNRKTGKGAAFNWQLLPSFFHSSPRQQMAEIYYSDPVVQLEKVAPDFEAPAIVEDAVTKIKLSHYRGRWVVLLFYPKDFTFVCPTEIIAFNDRMAEFEKLETRVLAISTDTEEVHLAWCNTPRLRGGLGHMDIPLIADTSKSISADYGTLIVDGPAQGIANRGLFIINPEGIVKHISFNSLSVGRSVDETLRLIAAHQYVREHDGEVCPANWRPGEKAMYGDTDRSKSYFASGATEPQSHKEDEDRPIFIVPPEMVDISTPEEYYSLIKSESKVVVDFVAPWCKKCQHMFPYVIQMSKLYPDIKFAKFTTDSPALQDLGIQLDVSMLPSIHFYYNGDEAKERITGYKKQLFKRSVEALSKL